jgi:hypothetical protein
MTVALAEAACEAERRPFDRGDKPALHRAISVCAKAGIPLPSWCAEAFICADEIKPHKKGEHVREKAKEEEWRSRVYVAVLSERQGFNLQEIVRAHQQGPKAMQKLRKKMLLAEKREIPFREIWPRIAKRFKLTEAVCKQYYYAERKARNKPRGKIIATVALTASGDVVTKFEK